MSDFLLIDNEKALVQLCEDLSSAAWLALDTEFMREKTYYPQLCLLQVAVPGMVACVDPLALPDLSPLFELLHIPTILKVLHAARQDLEILFHLTGSPVDPVFDTQLAAGLCGFGDQAGYASVVAGLLGIQLAKQHTRTNWGLRPLPTGALQYAADDVRYLVEIYPQLDQQLQAQGRQDWLADDLEMLTREETFRPDPENAWRRLRAARKLKPAALGRAQALAAWREETAMSKNLPRQWLMRDDLLIDIARRAPANMEQLSKLRGAPRTLLERHGQTLLNLTASASPMAFPQPPAAAPPQQEALVDLMMALVRHHGEQQNVSPGNLATRSELARLAGGERHLPVVQGWRHAVIGKDLLALLNGNLQIQIKDGELMIDTPRT